MLPAGNWGHCTPVRSPSASECPSRSRQSAYSAMSRSMPFGTRACSISGPGAPVPLPRFGRVTLATGTPAPVQSRFAALHPLRLDRFERRDARSPVRAAEARGREALDLVALLLHERPGAPEHGGLARAGVALDSHHAVLRGHDELHRLFLPGREGAVPERLVDDAGAHRGGAASLPSASRTMLAITEWVWSAGSRLREVSWRKVTETTISATDSRRVHRRSARASQ